MAEGVVVGLSEVACVVLGGSFWAPHIKGCHVST